MSLSIRCLVLVKPRKSGNVSEKWLTGTKSIIANFLEKESYRHIVVPRNYVGGYKCHMSSKCTDVTEKLLTGT